MELFVSLYLVILQISGLHSIFNYICIVRLDKVFLSRFFLLIYLSVLGHQAIAHSHYDVQNVGKEKEHSHQHEDHLDQHHQHHFHIGIFHFIGHLLERVTHADNTNEDPHIVTQKHSKGKSADVVNSANQALVDVKQKQIDPFQDFSKYLEYYPDLHYKRLQNSSSPLRAPPLKA